MNKDKDFEIIKEKIEEVESLIEAAKEKTAEHSSSRKSKAARSSAEGKSRSSAPQETSIIPQDQMLPSKLFIIPLQGRPIFPGIFTPLMINSDDDVRTVEQAYGGDGYIGICMLKNDAETPTTADLCDVGTVARIIKKINLPDGGVNIFISTLKRFRVRKSLHATAPMAVAVQYLDDEEDDTFEVKALTRALISEMKEVSENNPLFSEEMRLNMVNIDHPGKIADFIASILNIDKKEQQRVLEITNVRQRMEQVLVFIKKEQELLRVQKKIQHELNEKVEKNQRQYFLREEMKSIQEELGTDADGNISDYKKYKEKIAAFNFEGEIKETVESELEKFNLTDPNSPEYIGTRNFLELVINLPWNDQPKESYSLEQAKKILERDHFGLEDVKKRVLEFLAVRKLKQDSKGSILLLVGPPGVGKTSVGKSIADSMSKPFYRFSVGGLRDEAEIKGHRRTYIGALPGKIIQGLKTTKTRAPVFMIDEIDKMGESFHGDPASALLEVLDPEQNINFRDNYLDLPFDISDIFFILTANTLDSIPDPLLDRAEIITLPGYIDQEKIEIAKHYIIPKNLIKNGLAKGKVKYTNAALTKIAEEYAREAGVRNYEKCIDKIHRKIVTEMMNEAEKLIIDNGELTIKNEKLKIKNEKSGKAATKTKVEQAKDAENVTVKSAETSATANVSDTCTTTTTTDAISADEKFIADFFKEQKPRTVDAGDLHKYLGKPVFDESEIKKAETPGTAIGLAWTSMGGDTLLIESTVFPGKGELTLTGQMGDVMKESAQIALNWTKRYVLEHHIKEPEWFEQNNIHLHIPEGATPKDGPSAGITMATTFLSLFSGKTIKPRLAMTGELSLTGQVLPIGGLREKTVAARRNGIKTILIPKANTRDLEEIPERVKKGIEFMPVTKAVEVVDAVFAKSLAKK